jgi:NAD(P)-dependent dehydrogenase (short-subunit alcohol dehydrogenase family)
MNRLADKVALITGTAGGQGRAAAPRFAAEGATVAGCDVKADGASETVEMVRASGGRMTSTHPLDLADETAVQDWVDDVAGRHGGIDVVYNNAGATRFTPVEQTTYADWSFTMRNELDIVFLVTRAAWPHLKARGGSVLLVGSIAGITGSMTNQRVAHTASQGGVVADQAAGRRRHLVRDPGQLRQPRHGALAGDGGRPAGPRLDDARHRPRDPAGPRRHRRRGGLLRVVPRQ